MPEMTSKAPSHCNVAIANVAYYCTLHVFICIHTLTIFISFTSCACDLHFLSVSLVEGNPEVAVDSIVHLAQHMSPSQRAEVLRILTAVDAPTAAS